MGIPRFFRYITERYPCVNEVITEYTIPQFDNLYLDVNGIIHQCSHPNDEIVMQLSEEELFDSIFYYIEYLLLLIRPKKIFFIAIDGVAPRAKMNQQRGRRFRAARDMESKKKKLENMMDSDKVFDSNCISPGTEFMARLDEYLCKAIADKVASDEVWQKIKVYYSGHLTPGEGEHKIMEFIRFLRSQSDYNVETRHCMYGLDADLIVLGLVVHEPYFSLLREEVVYSKRAKRNTSPNNIRWYIFHISLLREYIDLEFQSVKTLLSFEYDIERIIDDWVLIAFLAGNDFIPTVPGLYIGDGTLAVLWNYYKETLADLNGYLNTNGELDHKRFAKFIENLAQYDISHFKTANAEYEWYENTGINLEEYSSNNSGTSPSKKELPVNMHLEDDDEIDSESDSADEFIEMGLTSTESLEFKNNKSNYYRSKLHFTDLDTEVPKLCEEYFRALQWILKYYYVGCPSWDWYFPYHYAPYLTDLRFCELESISFSLGKPFRPFEQLLAILPPPSRLLLPKPFQDLIESKSLIHFYPKDFEVDLNNKLSDYESIVLIPFIDEKLLQKVIKPLEAQLTPEEKARNSVRPCLIYSYKVKDFGTEEHTNCNVEEVESFQVPFSSIRFGLLNDLYIVRKSLSFPLLRTLKFKFRLEDGNLHVFQNFPTRYESMILVLRAHKKRVDKDLARKYLGKLICVEWPHFVRAKVVSVSDINGTFTQIGESKDMLKYVEHDAGGRDSIHKESLYLQQRLWSRFGISVVDSSILLNVVKLKGIRHYIDEKGNFQSENVFDENASYVLLETTFLKANDFVVAKDDDICDSVSKLKTHSIVFCLDQAHYGSMARVKSVSGDGQRVNVVIDIFQEPDLTSVSRTKEDEMQYFPAHIIASMVSVPTNLIAKLTGFILLYDGNKVIHLGFNWKSNKHNTETPGYTKKINNQWKYSLKAKNLIVDFVSTFPEFTETITNFLDYEGKVEVNHIWPNGNGLNEINKMKKWIDNCPASQITKVSSTSTCLSLEVLETLEDILKDLPKEKLRSVEVSLPSKHVYIPTSSKFDVFSLSGADFRLLDRVVNIKSFISVPLGARGTITALKNDDVTVMFDKEFKFGRAIKNTSKKHNCYVLPSGYLINVSKRKRSEMRDVIDSAEHQVEKPAMTSRTVEKKHPVRILRPVKANTNEPSYTRVTVKDLFDSVTSVTTSPASKVTSDSAVDTSDNVDTAANTGDLTQNTLMTKCRPKFEYHTENGFVLCKMTAILNRISETFVGVPSLSAEEAKQSAMDVALREISNLLDEGYYIEELSSLSTQERKNTSRNKHDEPLLQTNKPLHENKSYKSRSNQNHSAHANIPRWRKPQNNYTSTNAVDSFPSESEKTRLNKQKTSTLAPNLTAKYPLQNCEYLYQWAVANHLPPPLYEFNVTSNNLIICDAIVTTGIAYKRFMGVPSISKEAAADSAAFSALQYYRNYEIRASELQPAFVSPVVFPPDMNVGQRFIYPFCTTPQYDMPYSYTPKPYVPFQPSRSSSSYLPKYRSYYPSENKSMDEQYNVVNSTDVGNDGGIPFIPVQAIKRMASKATKTVDCTTNEVNLFSNNEFTSDGNSGAGDKTDYSLVDHLKSFGFDDESGKAFSTQMPTNNSSSTLDPKKKTSHCNVACNFNFEIKKK